MPPLFVLRSLAAPLLGHEQRNEKGPGDGSVSSPLPSSERLARRFHETLNLPLLESTPDIVVGVVPILLELDEGGGDLLEIRRRRGEGLDDRIDFGGELRGCSWRA
jgi:hypothetical protein